ncbi:hypothetical protein V1477_014664 [Vespula maculifrons]|uniref:Uncharacterized protein n=1 Tax=Vespula maculifrons TaxID=7453 RepID=A0ABD2BJ36_VESMC
MEVFKRDTWASRARPSNVLVCQMAREFVGERSRWNHETGTGLDTSETVVTQLCDKVVLYYIIY